MMCLLRRQKHLEIARTSVSNLEFRYLRNLMNENKLYRGDPRLLMYVFFHDGQKQAEIARTLLSESGERFLNASEDGAGSRSCGKKK